MTNLSFRVVVPAHQAENEISACLRALLADGFPGEDILVVDDGSRDATGALARSFGVRVVRNEVPAGPADARNRGAASIDADILVFVDADVVIHRGSRDRLVAAFAGASDLAAIFGSYDDRPFAPGIVSRYRNLLHHYTHQTSRTEAATFWTGFGAVKSAVFHELGGLDSSWQDIEDVEFGNRIKRSGRRIRLDRELMCTHLKAWTARSMFRTDLKGRAIPWTRMMRTEGLVADDLNVTMTHRISALMVVFFAIGLLTAFWQPAGLWLAAAALLGFAVVSRHFAGFLVKTCGLGFAIGALPFHALHYVAALCGYGYVLATEAMPGRSRRLDAELEFATERS